MLEVAFWGLAEARGRGAQAAREDGARRPRRPVHARRRPSGAPRLLPRARASTTSRSRSTRAAPRCGEGLVIFFRITEGPKVEIACVQFEGNHSFSKSKLLKVMPKTSEDGVPEGRAVRARGGPARRRPAEPLLPVRGLPRREGDAARLDAVGRLHPRHDPHRDRGGRALLRAEHPARGDDALRPREVPELHGDEGRLPVQARRRARPRHPEARSRCTRTAPTCRSTCATPPRSTSSATRSTS